MFLLDQIIPKDFLLSVPWQPLQAAQELFSVSAAVYSGLSTIVPMAGARSVHYRFCYYSLPGRKCGSSKSRADPPEVYYSFLNGFLIYASATGKNQIVGENAGAGKGGTTAGHREGLHSKRKLFTRWFS